MMAKKGLIPMRNKKEEAPDRGSLRDIWTNRQSIVDNNRHLG